MTKPADPEKGKAAEAEQAEVEAKDAAAAKGQEDAEVAAEAPKPKAAKKPAAKKQAEDTAAETTKVDKAAAEAVSTEKKPAAKKPAAKKKADTDDKPVSTEKKPAKKAPRGAPKEAAKPARKRKRGEQPAVLVRAEAKYVRSSARKARLVCDAIRGKSVVEARAILAFHPRQVSEAWTKVLESAVANAEHNHELVGEELVVHSVYADEGPTIKRFRPRAMGRATRIRKRTSHLTIQLAPKES